MKNSKFLCLMALALIVLVSSGGCGGGSSSSFVDNNSPDTQSQDVTPAPTSPDVTTPTVDVEDPETVSTILSGLNAPNGTEVMALPESASGSKRTLNDLSDEEKAAIPANETAAAALPTMSVDKDAVYVFGVALNNLNAGDAIYLHMISKANAAASEFSAADAEDGSYIFLDDDGKTVTTVPANKHVNAAVYMTAGKTYAPVITKASASSVTPEVSPDNPSPTPVPTPTSPDVAPESGDTPAPTSPDVTPQSGDVPPTPPESGDNPAPTSPDVTPQSGDVPPTPPTDSDDATPSTDSEDVTPSVDSDDATPSTDSEDVTSYTATEEGKHAIELTSGTASYSDVTVTKTGDATGQSDGESGYDWTGSNAAVFASGGSTLTIEDATITSNATGGNAVFAYGGNLSGSGSGDGTKITISNSTITTSKNNSGGIMVTGGGTIEASNLTITTQSGSSAAIRSDRGGGTITVTGGTYTANGQGSPAIYSTADITGNDVTLVSGIAQVVVIEGGNSVTLDNATLTANHTSLNGNDSYYQAVLIYQSMSGDASDGSSSFTMTGGSITNANGDIFHVTNTTTTITLSESINIVNNDSSGYFLRASSGSWGSSGSNGGKVTLNADGQDINGNMLVDSVSTLALNLKNSSDFEGAVNSSGQAGTVSVVLDATSTWTLTGNSYVTSLTNNGTINTGSYTLYVNGTAYTE
ncbi:MAG: hypothetical protein IJT02_05765 [Synergistaceae bacterium]|nr:hypothetical protein [Synergistaceae bacterium]